MAGLKYNVDKQMRLFAPFGKPVAPDCGPMPQVIKVFQQIPTESFLGCVEGGSTAQTMRKPTKD
jgi:hypothetical protein